jgi:hypothetical protein
MTTLAAVCSVLKIVTNTPLQIFLPCHIIISRFESSRITLRHDSGRWGRLGILEMPM